MCGADFKLRGDIKQRQRNFHGALLDYTRAEKEDPDDARLYVSRSAVHISEGHLREAVQDCDLALKIDPNDADAWYNRACADYMASKPLPKFRTRRDITSR